jgi:23S rRNA pseudouridine1911/1915/1917 synthase
VADGRGTDVSGGGGGEAGAAARAGIGGRSTWTVGGSDAGVRLDKFLASSDRLGSRGRAVEALDRGKVLLGETELGRIDAAHRLAVGERVTLWMDRPGTAKRRSQRTGDLIIRYEDAALVVVDKPAGLLSVPLARRSDAASVVDQLEDHLRARGRIRPLVVHRIDRDTSGLVVFAKQTGAFRSLKDQFRRREAERVYLAIVYGCPEPASGRWEDTLVWDEQALIQKATHRHDPDGKEALADYRVVEHLSGTSLLEIRLVTGKRNQIRLQARLRGHTLVGERRYVYGPDSLRPIEFSRQALHAHRLGFVHPVTGLPLRLESPVPDDMTELLARLRAGRATDSDRLAAVRV